MRISSLLGHTQELLSIIQGSNKPADSIIDSYFRSRKYLGSHDRRFIAETVYGTLRHLRWCDNLVHQALGKLVMETLPDDGLLLIIAACAIAIGKERGITISVLKERLKGKWDDGQLQSLIEKAQEQDVQLPTDTIQRLGVQYSFPDWMAEKISKQYGDQTEPILAALNQQGVLTLRVNTLKTTVDECKKRIESEDVEARKTKYSPCGLHIMKRVNIFKMSAFKEGFFEVQDEGSQMLPLLIDPKPTFRVLDACAGAGGKTLALAAIMKGRGEIYATDVQDFRLEELRKRMRRAGAFNIRVQSIDQISDLREQYSEYFDVVFVDAPCSGIGTIRRNPGMKWMVTEETVKEISEKQKFILKASADLVKTGGVLAYATCTLFREENEEVVEQFLQSHSQFVIEDLSGRLENYKLSFAASKPYVKFMPHQMTADGFFMAMMRKSG